MKRFGILLERIHQAKHYTLLRKDAIMPLIEGHLTQALREGPSRTFLWKNLEKGEMSMIAQVWKMQANNSITLLPAPITINIGEWIISNIGMVAVAKRLSDNTATLYAVEKADTASPQMVKYAKDNNAMILVGISEGEANAID